MSKILTKKWLLPGLIILLVCLLLAFFLGVPRYIGCQIDKHASNAEITSITLREIGLTRLSVDIGVMVENPNPIGATVDRVAYDIYFQLNNEWVHLGRADKDENIAIGSHEQVTVEVTHEIGTLSVVRMLLQAFLQQGVVDIKASGSVWIKIWFMSFEIPFEHVGAVALLGTR